MKDFDYTTMETVDPPQIIWDKNDRFAIVAFLLLSVDRQINADSLKKIDEFMGLGEQKAVNSEEETDDNYSMLLAVREAVIREGNAFLESIENDEDRYDCIIDELNRVFEGSDVCSIGDGYSASSAKNRNNLDGAAYWLFDCLKLVVFDDDYSGNKKRFLKYLARKWNIGLSVL